MDTIAYFIIPYFTNRPNYYEISYILLNKLLYLPWIFYFMQLVTNQEPLHAYSLEVGHKYVSSAAEVPYQVLVVYGNLYCSGTLVRSKIAITTAGCVTAGPKDKTYVKVGANSITGLGQVIPVVTVKIHEYFRYYSRMDNDIAMLVLKENVIFSNRVKKVLLIDPDNEIEPGVFIQVTGWASQGVPQKYANMLLHADMEILDREECIDTYDGLITPSNFCAKFHAERRLSDIGGPATYKQMLVGIMSFGALQHYDPSVAVFTNVTYFHKWILLNTKLFLEKHCIIAKESLNFTQQLSSAEVTINKLHTI